MFQPAPNWFWAQTMSQGRHQRGTREQTVWLRRMTYRVMCFRGRNGQQAQTARPTQFPKGAGGKHS
jgi:hypothetical protein